MEHDIDKLKETCIGAVEIAYMTVKSLGRVGIAKVSVPGKDDIVTKADLEVSSKWREYFAKTSIPLLVLTEESRDIPFERRNEAKYLGIGDEIDGTSNYNRSRGIFPSCAIFTIFDNLEPKFNDAIVTAVKNHLNGDLWYAVQGQGCYLNGERVYASKTKELGKDTLVIIDEGYCVDPASSLRYFMLNQKIWRKNISSAGIHMAGVASGSLSGWDGFVCFGQKPEELASGNLLIKEAGGYLIDTNGVPIGPQIFNWNKTLEIIAAGTKELGESIRREILSVEQARDIYHRFRDYLPKS